MANREQTTSGSWLRLMANGVALLAVVGILFLFGVRQFQDKIAIAKPIQFIGHADEAAYATMGRSLAEGRGLQVPYVSYFFIPYSPEITRREDHWPPFMGFAIAPCFYFLGQATWVAKLPAMAFASIGLPLTTALLAYGLSRRGYVAIVAGLLMMAHPFMYHESLGTLSDVATAMLVAGFCGSIVLARRWPWMHLLAGAFAAGAFYAKGSEVLLLALYPVLALVACGIGTWRRGWFWAGMATAVFLMAPFWYSSWRLYGNPLHSTQNYVSGYFSFEDWEAASYYPYWGHNPPKTSDRWTKYASTYWRTSSIQLEDIARTSLTGSSTGADTWADFGGYGLAARDFLNGTWARLQGPGPIARWFGWIGRAEPRTVNPERRKAFFDARWAKPIKPLSQWQLLPWELAAAAAVCLFVWLLFTWPASLFLRGQRWLWRHFGDSSVAPLGIEERPDEQPLLGPVSAVVLVIVIHGVFLAYFWSIRARFSFTFLPLFAALGCTGATYFLERPIAAMVLAMAGVLRKHRLFGAAPTGGLRRRFPAWHVVLTIAFAAGLALFAQPLQARYATWLDSHLQRGGYPFEDDGEYPALGQWVSKNLPKAVFMTRNPWEFTFYCPRTTRAVAYPAPDDESSIGAGQIFAIARYYHVTHLIIDGNRPALFPYIRGRKPGLKRIRGAPSAVFEIDWSQFPVETVEQALAKK